MTTALTSNVWRATEASAPITELSQTASTARVSVKLLAPFIDAARALNIRIAGGLASAGLTRADLDKPDLRVSHALIDRMLRTAVSTSGERALGLLAAERLQPSHLDVVEYAARAQPTLRCAIEQSIRYYALLHDGMEGELQVRGDRATLSIGFGELPVAAAGIEFALAAHLIVARRITGIANLAPLETHFTHPRPRNTVIHQQIFGASLHFGRQRNALVYAAETLDKPLIAADPGLASVLERYAAQSLQNLGHKPSLSELVRELIAHDLSSGKLSAERLALRLGMSSRTLQRRLVADGASYRVLIDEVRRDIALRCLHDPKLTIREIGFLLGFGAGPAFHRAFRRWTGTTIARYRSELQKVLEHAQLADSASNR